MTSSMNPPYPCPTRTWHTDTYPAISPSLPALSQRHRTILVTGGETTIGRATVLAFAAASAHRIILLGGQHAQPLEETRDLVMKQYPKCYVEWFNIDVADEGKVVDVLDAIEEALKPDWRWDVLVLIPEAEADERRLVEKRTYDEGDQGVEEWWKAFELNLKGNYILSHHFLPKRSRKASIIASVPCSIHLSSPAHISGQSAYLSSKIALIKFLEVVAAENPDLFVASYHPGNVPHPLKTGTNIPSHRAINNPADKPTLSAHFAVWLCSPLARFVRGKYVWANWDVEELRIFVSKIKRVRSIDHDRSSGGEEGSLCDDDGGEHGSKHDQRTTNGAAADNHGQEGAREDAQAEWGTLNILGWPYSPSLSPLPVPIPSEQLLPSSYSSLHSLKQVEYNYDVPRISQAQRQQRQNGTNNILEMTGLDDWEDQKRRSEI